MKKYIDKIVTILNVIIFNLLSFLLYTKIFLPVLAVNQCYNLYNNHLNRDIDYKKSEYKIQKLKEDILFYCLINKVTYDEVPEDVIIYHDKLVINHNEMIKKYNKIDKNERNRYIEICNYLKSKNITNTEIDIYSSRYILWFISIVIVLSLYKANKHLLTNKIKQ